MARFLVVKRNKDLGIVRLKKGLRVNTLKNKKILKKTFGKFKIVQAQNMRKALLKSVPKGRILGKKRKGGKK